MRITGWWMVGVALIGCIESPATADPEPDEVAMADGAADAAVDDAAVDDAADRPPDAEPDVVAPPCIRVTPDQLEFESGLVGRAFTRAVLVESCGGQPLEINALSLVGDAVFSLPDSAAIRLPAAGAEAPSALIEVAFTPLDRAAYQGTLVLETNDPERAQVAVPLVGRGTMNACPVAAVAQDAFDVLPLDIVELDGQPSVDADGPEGRPVAYRWDVIERPAGSTAQPVERFENPRDPANTGVIDDEGTSSALFFADLTGRYVIELVVEDALGFRAPSEACPQAPARVMIEARPNEDLHIELVWDTPGDPDQTDGNGADVDLHLLHPRGRNWAQAPLDCYYANASPDWGPAGPAGDPTLDIDDVNGAGPELISLNQPEDTTQLGGQYRVGVDYYRSEDYTQDGGGNWGPSRATVRIFLGGVEAGSWSRELAATHEFWEVATIVWAEDDRRVQVLDRWHAAVP
jgi:hypothetical protein